MRLSVPTPAGWSTRLSSGGELLRSADGTRELRVLPIEGAKTSVPRWIYRALCHELPAGVEPTEMVNGQLKTAAAWTAITVEAAIGDRSRVVVYFCFLDQSATVIATASGLGPRDWCDEVVALLYAAIPDFTGDKVSGVKELLGSAPPAVIAQPEPIAVDDWRRNFSGGDVVLTSIADPDSGWIRCSPRQGPIEPAWHILHDAGEPPELGVTAEGEYFALATTRSGATSRITALVFGPESYTRIEASVLETERLDTYHAAVRALAFETSLGLGVGRNRPYYYDAPATWFALPRPGSTVWISPGCGWRYHVLRVFDARTPERDAATRIRRFETLAAEFGRQPARGPAVFWTRDGLECRVTAYDGTFGGERLRILDGAVIDANYIYPFRVECDPELFDESLRLFEDIAQSVIPLPAPTAKPTEASDAIALYSNWAE